MARINKTVYRFDWVNGYTKQMTLSRSFVTLEAAQKFAEGKQTIGIYRNKGRFVVEWIKIIDNNG